MTFKVYKSDHSRIAWAAVIYYLDTLNWIVKVTGHDKFLEVDTTAMSKHPKLGPWAEQHVFDTIQSFVDR